MKSSSLGIESSPSIFPKPGLAQNSPTELLFPGLRLFGGLLLLILEKVPKAMFIWGATTIWQVRVVPHWKALMSDCLEPAGQGLGRTFRVH